MDVLTYEKALGFLQAAVDKMGEDHEAVCRYVEDGEPACIVGHVLFEAGVSIDVLGAMGSEGIGSVVGRLPFDCDPKAVQLLQYAQAYQDDGCMWGQALRYAIRETDSQA